MMLLSLSQLMSSLSNLKVLCAHTVFYLGYKLEKVICDKRFLSPEVFRGSPKAKVTLDGVINIFLTSNKRRVWPRYPDRRSINMTNFLDNWIILSLLFGPKPLLLKGSLIISLLLAWVYSTVGERVLDLVREKSTVEGVVPALPPITAVPLGTMFVSAKVEE